MKKNVASQAIGAQMITASDGSAFTGTVSCLVTVDSGTQTAGGGAVTHEGNGYHSYAPTQAETNGDHVAFTFTGTGAVPATVQVYTTFPQTGDSFARVGAPAGASVSADVAAIQAETATILADTNDIQTRIPAALVAGRIDASVGAMAVGVLTATAIAADAITDAKVAADVTIASVTGSVGSVTGAVGSVTGSVGSVTGAVGSVTGAVGSVTGNVGGNVVGSVASVTAGVTVTTNNDKTGYGLSATAVQAIWGALTAALTTVGSIGKLLVDNVNASISAVKAKTDSLTFTKAGEVDANIQSVNDVTVNGNGSPGTEWGP